LLSASLGQHECILLLLLLLLPLLLLLLLLLVLLLLLLVAGVIPAHDIVFSIAWPAYLAAANIVRFRSNTSHKQQAPGPLYPAAWVKMYAGAAAILALLLPGLICVHAAMNAKFASSSSSSRVSGCDDNNIIGCVSNSQVLIILGPHLYLTAMQVLCEFLSSSSVTGNRTALLPRLLVPIGFNTYRMWVFMRWCVAAVAAGLGPWQVGLAFLNLGFWAYNLFVFLLLRVVPYYLDPQRCTS
jgi:hypothetical protein